MVQIPEPVNAVELAVENKSCVQNKSISLGMSSIGNSCSRQQWYSWRWVKDVTITTQKQRVFEVNERHKERVIQSLENAGMVVTNRGQPIKDDTGHLKGCSTGKVINVPSAEKTEHLAEFKYMTGSNFNSFKNKVWLLGFNNALKTEYSSYWCKIQVYMGFLGLKRCLYIITNKDNEKRLYERVSFQPQQFELIKNRALHIISSEKPPQRITDREDWYECRACSFKSVCFGYELPDKNCKTCKFAQPQDGGTWVCLNNKNNILSVQEQIKGCQKHTFVEDLCTSSQK